MVNDSDLEKALENVIKSKAREKALWPNISDFVPEMPRIAISQLDLSEDDIQWSQHERVALKKLLNSERLMSPVFKHLELFELNEQEWRDVLVEGILAPYDEIFSRKKIEREAAETETEEYYQEVSKAAYHLHMLMTQWCDLLPRDSSLDNYLEESNIANELLKVVSHSTSVHWPLQLYNWNNNRNASFNEMTAIDNLRYKETEWLCPSNLSSADDIVFPSRNKNEFVGGYASYQWTKFIEEALLRLDEVSNRCDRNFLIEVKKGIGEVPSKSSYIFFQPMHWRNLCELLFSQGQLDSGMQSPKDQYQNRTINSIVKKHRDNSEHYVKQVK